MMTENSVRDGIGLLIIGLHIALFVLLFVVFLNSGFRYDEFTTSAAIILPMFAGYTTAIAIHFSRYRFKISDSSARVTYIFVVLSALFPVLLFLTISTSVLLYANSRVFENFEQFKGTLTLLEATFATYIARFIYTLFERVAEERPRDPSTKHD
jgi:hypothetical protein